MPNVEISGEEFDEAFRDENGRLGIGHASGYFSGVRQTRSQ
jgi:hypothetical protein